MIPCHGITSFVRNCILYWKPWNPFLRMNSIPFNLSTDVDECHSNPCQHGGTCTDQIGGYHCTCSAGSTGTECQTGECLLLIIDKDSHSTVTTTYLTVHIIKN